MNKNKSKSSNGSCLMTCLKGLGIFCLLGVFLVFGWIAGLIWLIFFRKKTAPEKQKRNTILISTASIFSFIFFLYGMFFAPPTPTELTISCQEESELDIDTDYIITLDYGPEDADISSVSCDTDNISIADIERDNNDSTKFILHTKSSGTINITANSGSIESNTLTFHIVDKEQQALLEEQEKLAKELEVQENETIVEEETETVEKETESIDEEETKTIVEKEKTVQENVGKKKSTEEVKAETTQTETIKEEIAEEKNISSESNNETNEVAPTDTIAHENQAEEVSVTSETASSSDNNTNNFNTYDNPEQQQTSATYVLNTHTMKIHYPSCHSVAKIAPQNYSTSNQSIDELKAQGYVPCKNCFK